MAVQIGENSQTISIFDDQIGENSQTISILTTKLVNIGMNGQTISKWQSELVKTIKPFRFLTTKLVKTVGECWYKWPNQNQMAVQIGENSQTISIFDDQIGRNGIELFKCQSKSIYLAIEF